MLMLLAANGVNLHELLLKGCSLVRDGQLLEKATRSIRHLDLSWSGIRTLPRRINPTAILPAEDDWDTMLVDPEEEPVWPHMTSLKLSACDHLQRDSLSTFLTDTLPPSIHHLNLSDLSPYVISKHALHKLSVTSSYKSAQPTSLQIIDLSRIDILTVQDIQHFSSHWSSKRNEQQPSIRIKHTAILESDDPAGYRQFIRFLSGGLP